MRRLFGILAAGLVLAATPYQTEIASWRSNYEAELRAPGGWLAVAGLFWLHEGDNAVGSDPLSDIVMPPTTARHAGVLKLAGGKVEFLPVSGPGKELKPDTPGPPDVVDVGGVAMTIIVRGGKMGVRLRDPDAPGRRDFVGSRWYPAAEKWLVRAKWIPAKAGKTIPITNVLGMTSEEPTPGTAVFQLGGQTLSLEPVIEDGDLFFMFKDATSGHSTYGAGRFLHAAMPKDGSVELDFNKAYNPPCAFTAFATCPLPPKQNNLALAVEAGEMNYGKH